MFKKTLTALTLTTLFTSLGCSAEDGATADVAGKADDWSETERLLGGYCDATTNDGRHYLVDFSFYLDPSLLNETPPYSIRIEDAQVTAETSVTDADDNLVEAESLAQAMDTIEIDLTDDGASYRLSSSVVNASGTPDYLAIAPTQGDVAGPDRLDFKISEASSGGRIDWVTGAFANADCVFYDGEPEI